MTPNNPSKPVPLEAEAVEAAAKAAETEIHRFYGPLNLPHEDEIFDRAAQAAIHAFLDAMGVTVEYSSVPIRGSTYEWRLGPSRWFPIKGPVDE